MYLIATSNIFASNRAVWHRDARQVVSRSFGIARGHTLCYIGPFKAYMLIGLIIVGILVHVGRDKIALNSHR